MKENKTSIINLRVSAEVRDRIDAVCARESVGAYRVTVTSIVERGIELALVEIDDISKNRLGG